MSFDAEQLYKLLPAIYRIRDTEQGNPLNELISVIADQIAVIEESMEQLYDDQFIETCADWAVPYIGDLIGYRSLHSHNLQDIVPKVATPRREVAHTIGFRRRKGTVTMLEQLARDVTAWDARVVEFFKLLGWSQNMNHIRQDAFFSPNMRSWEQLERLSTPFDSVAHTVDVRRISTGQGLYNVPNIGVFMWRLRAYPLTKSNPFKVDDKSFKFNPLGLDSQLFTFPDDQIANLAEPINVPMPISRRMLDNSLSSYYGNGLSIFLDGIDADKIVACDLFGWAHKPPPGKVGIDPVLGRIAFAEAPTAPPLVTFHYGFSADLGGGEYDRSEGVDASLKPVKVPDTFATIQTALDALSDGGAVEITNSTVFSEAPSINVNAKKQIELRAIDGRRPTLMMSKEMQIRGGAESQVTINGLLLAGGGLRVPVDDNQLRTLRLRHCTLVPTQTSLNVELPGVQVEIDHCILGEINVSDEAEVDIVDSVLDSTKLASEAFTGLKMGSSGGPLQITDCTVVGRVLTHELKLASNTVFLSDVRSDKRQEGCVRFCYLPPSPQSNTPRRYRCQPKTGSAPTRVAPMFTSLQFGDPGYCQLAQRTPLEIRTGADDEGEMGVFHKLYQPQRETNLRIRLEEYLPFRLEAGIFYVT